MNYWDNIFYQFNKGQELIGKMECEHLDENITVTREEGDDYATCTCGKDMSVAYDWDKYYEEKLDAEVQAQDRTMDSETLDWD